MDSSALNTKRAWRPKGLAGLRLHNPLAGPGGAAGRATTPAAAPPNPSGPWRAGRKGLTFASDADRDRYEKGRSDGDRSGGEDRSDGVRSGVGPRGAHGEGAGLEASGHGSMDRRVSFAAQAEESGSPVRGSLKRGASSIADGAVGPHGQSLYVPPILDWRIRGWVARLLPELGAASTRPVLCLGAAPTPLAPSQRSGAVPAQYSLCPRCKGPRGPRGASTSVPVRCRSPPPPPKDTGLRCNSGEHPLGRRQG